MWAISRLRECCGHLIMDAGWYAYMGCGRIMLLKRTDTDTSIKDIEGYTAFDLYNSTVRTANPTSLEDGYADLLTWGANRWVLS